MYPADNSSLEETMKQKTAYRFLYDEKQIRKLEARLHHGAQSLSISLFFSVLQKSLNHSPMFFTKYLDIHDPLYWTVLNEGLLVLSQNISTTTHLMNNHQLCGYDDCVGEGKC